MLLVLSMLTLPLLLCYLSFITFSPSSARPSRPSTASSSSLSATSFLFPASAIISLTDDNSTFFISRPAAFGPPLPKEGMTGELFVLEDGQLACDDTPGWDPSSSTFAAPGAGSAFDLGGIVMGGGSGGGGGGGGGSGGLGGGSGGGGGLGGSVGIGLGGGTRALAGMEDDGTDDMLNPIVPSGGSGGSSGGSGSSSSGGSGSGSGGSGSGGGSSSGGGGGSGSGSSSSSSSSSNWHDNWHADIQSLQQSAEIDGKIVLVARGGCGFLEKVLWTQRRGGVALIVGDYRRAAGPGGIGGGSGSGLGGSGLVTMYAKGTSHFFLFFSLLGPSGADKGIDTG